MKIRFFKKTLELPEMEDFIGFAIIGTFTLIFAIFTLILLMNEKVVKLFAFVFRGLKKVIK